MVQMSGLKDENKILRFPAKSRTFFRMTSKNRLISKGAWHSLVPSLSFMSHLTSMLKPHVSSIFVNASSRVGKGSWSSSTSVNSLTPFTISKWWWSYGNSWILYSWHCKNAFHEKNNTFNPRNCAKVRELNWVGISSLFSPFLATEVVANSKSW